MSESPVPVIAVVGHPNEGKSSVVATLTENDQVGISEMPGETQYATPYPIRIDDQEVLRFIDTPGFQNPARVLQWFQAYQGDPAQIVSAFLEAHRGLDVFRHEIELFTPLAEGAGLIMVVDGSQPVHANARKEMEIIRLTGVPRMAVINRHSMASDYSEDWKTEFKRHFNTVRIFDAHQTNYAERLGLLEALKHMDQDWEPALGQMITAFTTYWENRNRQCVNLILNYVKEAISFEWQKPVAPDAPPEALAALHASAQSQYYADLLKKEHRLFAALRHHFHHHRYRLELDSGSILNEPLDSELNFRVLGLRRTQLAGAMALTGAALGAGADVAAAGLSFGIFTATGTLLGAVSGFFGGGHLARWKPLKYLHLPLLSKRSMGNAQLRVKNDNLQFFIILIDRALLYLQAISRWTHARRDAPAPLSDNASQGWVTRWSAEDRAVLTGVLQGWIKKVPDEKLQRGVEQLAAILERALKEAV